MLVNCVVYQEGRRVQDIPVEEIGRWIGRGDSFVWVALKDATAEELTAMQEQFGLHELAVEDARHGHQRPKIEEYGDSLFAVLQLVELQPVEGRASLGAGEMHVGEVDIFVGPDYVLSVRNRSEQGFLGVRSRAEREPQLLQYGSSFVFYALIDAVVDRYVPVIAQLESELEAIEEQIFSSETAHANIKRLYELKRKMTAMRHAVVPLMEGVGKLFGGRVPQLCKNTAGILPRRLRPPVSRQRLDRRDARDHRHRAAGQPVDGHPRAERHRQAARGMGGDLRRRHHHRRRLGHELQVHARAEWHYGYPLALAVIVAVCGLLYRRFRKARWL